MATINRQALNVQGQQVAVYAVGASRAGFGIGGTWTGLVSFLVSYDGLNFYPLTVTPFPSGTPVQSTTANGNFFANVNNAVAVAVVFTTLTTGTVNVVMAAANDGSWQDAFLAATSISLSQSVAGGLANVQTVAAQANRAWRCRSATIGFSVAPGAAVDFKITDGASSVLWEGYVPKDTPVGTWTVPLPPVDPTVPGSGGVVGSAGNSMVLTLAAPGGSVVSTVNAELHAA